MPNLHSQPFVSHEQFTQIMARLGSEKECTRTLLNARTAVAVFVKKTSVGKTTLAEYSETIDSLAERINGYVDKKLAFMDEESRSHIGQCVQKSLWEDVLSEVGILPSALKEKTLRQIGVFSAAYQKGANEADTLLSNITARGR